MKKRWYDYLWILSLTYLTLGFFNILFAWLGLLCFFIPCNNRFSLITKSYGRYIPFRNTCSFYYIFDGFAHIFINFVSIVLNPTEMINYLSVSRITSLNNFSILIKDYCFCTMCTLINT